MFKCLCCDQIVSKPGQRVTPEKAVRAFAFLNALGYSRESLLGEHRANIDFTAPGLAEWLEQQGDGHG
jgi:hypothetical protein